MANWNDKWNTVSREVSSFDMMTFQQFLDIVSKQWPVFAQAAAELKIPKSQPSNIYKKFVKHVDADLLLESGENASDDPNATIAEFCESVARQIFQVLNTDRFFRSYIKGASGIRAPFRLSDLMNNLAWFLNAIAMWLGEPIGRAGEGRPMFNPNDMGGGDQPWSQPN